MYQKKIALGCFTLIAIMLLLSGYINFALCSSENVTYLKNNIHTQEHRNEEYRASYANWTNPGKNHVIVPVNTPVKIGNFRRGFALITQDSRKTILFEYDESRMRMNEDQYIGLITSSEPVKIDDLSEVDRKGIKDGKVYEGMTKDGVRIALGYPAAHQTPSLNENTWVYWTNRFKSFKIEFDENRKVTKIQ
jgi:SmpA / OmlA family